MCGLGRCLIRVAHDRSITHESCEIFHRGRSASAQCAIVKFEDDIQNMERAVFFNIKEKLLPRSSVLDRIFHL